VQLVGALFERNATAAVAIQAALAEWGAGMMGIAWSDRLAPPPTAGSILGRVGRGALLGAAAAAAVVGASLATHGAARVSTPPAVGALVLGTLVACLAAVRDELLLRGTVLRLTHGVVPVWAGLLACGAAAAAARFGTAGAGGLALVVEGLRGAALGGLWVRDRGAWMACAANAAWAVALGPAVHGGAFDVRFATEADAGAAALVVVGAAAAAALGASLWPLPAPKAGLR